ncbi:hypothetical protein [Herbidospora sp. NBRC 101105]|uniref:hypothetical protein n=1 Tax=Herbidospora sp. NBRC 101105 TaxID=3032195 RepID=UPI0024A423D8|nr:hypothetical protein [Herbidospora sp. NBRC 101105]GLX94735.1 hypothetical protein Hesp01_26850 [Herbidospora sp. NBRC 101105]
MSVIISIVCATFGTFLDIHLVARAQIYCAGNLDAGAKFANAVWSLSRVVFFPIVSVLSAFAAQSFHLLAWLPWAARRSWPIVILLVLTATGSFAGPVAMIVYDLAAEDTPGDCVLPWWPSWLSS